MKNLVYVSLLLFCCRAALRAQAPPSAAPAPVPITEEPHHHLILANDYVRVFRVEIISPEATLLHRHDFPYAYMSIGKAEFTNAVEGKPEIRIKMNDGQLGYSKGGFSHIIRAENDTPFYNITIELLHPQGNVRSGCAKTVNGPLEGCSAPQPAAADTSPGAGANTPLAKSAPPAPPTFIAILETDEGTLKSGSFPHQAKTSLESSPGGTLLVIEPLSQFKLDFTDGTSKLLSGGDSLWLSPGPPITITNTSQQLSSTVLIFSFKDTPKPAAD
jgi:hypothetical protein